MKWDDLVGGSLTATASFKTRSLGLWDFSPFDSGFMQHVAAVNSVSSSRSARHLHSGLSILPHEVEKNNQKRLRHVHQRHVTLSPHADQE